MYNSHHMKHSLLALAPEDARRNRPKLVPKLQLVLPPARDRVLAVPRAQQPARNRRVRVRVLADPDDVDQHVLEASAGPAAPPRPPTATRARSRRSRPAAPPAAGQTAPAPAAAAACRASARPAPKPAASCRPFGAGARAFGTDGSPRQRPPPGTGRGPARRQWHCTRRRTWCTARRRA